MADGCVPISNQIAQLYNNKLKGSMLEELNKTLVETQFVYADIYAMSKDIIQNYISYGKQLIFIKLLLQIEVL